MLWSEQIADPAKRGQFISRPPWIVGDLVTVGPAGTDWATNGWVGTFELSDGSPVWQLDIGLTPGGPGAKSWGPDCAVLSTGCGAT